MLDLELEAWIIFDPCSLVREWLLFLPWHTELENFKFPNFWHQIKGHNLNLTPVTEIIPHTYAKHSFSESPAKTSEEK